MGIHEAKMSACAGHRKRLGTRQEAEVRQTRPEALSPKNTVMKLDTGDRKHNAIPGRLDSGVPHRTTIDPLKVGFP
jgi:hypothetical protein